MREALLEQTSRYGDVYRVDYDSIGEFYNYITKHQENKVWSDVLDVNKRLNEGKSERQRMAMKDFPCHSMRTTKDTKTFTGTSSFDEAVELFKNGIPDESEKLTKMLKSEKKLAPTSGLKRVNSMQGFQPNVPLYLMGVPTNMISQQMKPVKKKVLNLYADISYLAHNSADTIRRECIKKFRIISKLESQSYRVNLFLFVGTYARYGNNKQGFLTVIKLKSANERLNISKLAFPLVHPSMLRRLWFRWLETYETVRCTDFRGGYGSTFGIADVKRYLNDGFVLPTHIYVDVDDIKDLKDLEGLY